MKTKIPSTLDEAVDQLISAMKPKDKRDWKTIPFDKIMGMIHHLGGMSLRNEWGLWHGKTDICKWLRVNRIYHADDQSSTIFKALWCRVNDQPFDIKTEAAEYERFWRETAGLTWDMKPIPGLDRSASRTFTFKKT